MRLVQLSRHSIAFPSPEGALREPNGLLALGGDLSPARLLMAYQRGIFPWFSPGDPILWWSPDPRAVLWPESLHISRSMKRFHKRSPYRVTMNYAFGQVIEGCASDREEGTWITRGVVEAYHRLHELGHAHSIEVWREDELIVECPQEEAQQVMQIVTNEMEHAAALRVPLVAEAKQGESWYAAK